MTTSQQAATRAAIVAAVRAFVERVEKRSYGYAVLFPDEAWREAIRDELAALERTAAAADGETASE